MCTHSRTIFSCNHAAWGPRVRNCSVADDFRAGTAPSDCNDRVSHGLKTVRLQQKCEGCKAKDDAAEAYFSKQKSRLVAARETIAECRKLVANGDDDKVSAAAAAAAAAATETAKE